MQVIQLDTSVKTQVSDVETLRVVLPLQLVQDMTVMSPVYERRILFTGLNNHFT